MQKKGQKFNVINLLLKGVFLQVFIVAIYHEKVPELLPCITAPLQAQHWEGGDKGQYCKKGVQIWELLNDK